ITLSKTITPDNIGRKELIGFNANDLAELRKWSEVKQVYPIISNDFKVSADGGNFIPFYTDMYLEAVDNDAIDIPDLSTFKVENNVIPIVISREYLNLYNYGFALNQGLPQITEDFAKKIEVNINLTLKDKNVTYKGRLIGLSDRIHSVLVPKAFLDSLNATQSFAPKHRDIYTRVLVKVNDAKDGGLIAKMEQKGYESNQESLRSAKIKGKIMLVLQAIALLGIFILLLSVVLVINYIKMAFLERREEVSIKYALGYSPKKMVQQISFRFSRMLFVILLFTLGILSIAQYSLSKLSLSQGMLLPYLDPWLGIMAFVIPFVMYVVVFQLIYRWLIRSWRLIT
ncbi:MAG: FtsX-like permease family protein, partial [Flavobacterium sp.]